MLSGSGSVIIALAGAIKETHSTLLKGVLVLLSTPATPALRNRQWE
jgi:hypothetical protein